MIPSRRIDTSKRRVHQSFAFRRERPDFILKNGELSEALRIPESRRFFLVTHICVRIMELGERRGSVEGEDMCAWTEPFHRANSIVRLRLISVQNRFGKKAGLSE